MVVFIVKRYAAREAKKMAVRSMQGKNRAVRMEGVTLIHYTISRFRIIIFTINTITQ